VAAVRQVERMMEDRSILLPWGIGAIGIGPTSTSSLIGVCLGEINLLTRTVTEDGVVLLLLH